MSVPFEVQRLCDQVPWPPNEPHPLPASEAQILDAEARLGIRFPEPWKDFLQYMNGPCIGPGGLYGIRTERGSLDAIEIVAGYPTWISSGWLPVAGDGCGNFYVILMSAHGGCPVGFIETIASTDQIAYVVASDLWHFLTGLLERELGDRDWPFMRDYVLRRDPKLAECKMAPLPWEA